MLLEVEEIQEKSPETLPNKKAPTEECRKHEFSVAWCSWHDNTLSIRGYHGRKTSIIELEGAKLVKQAWSSTNNYNIVHHVPNTNFLVSTNTGFGAAFQVLDSKNNMSKFASYNDPEGVICDVASNIRANRTALMAVTNQVSFHLFDSKNWELLRKAKWPHNLTSKVSGLDFDPEGQKIALIDYYARCSIVDIDTEEPVHNVELGGRTANWKRCRWNPLNQLIALTFDENKLSLMDTNTGKILNSDPIKLHKEGITWIEWHNGGDLLASCSWDKTVRIFDLRKGREIKTFSCLHKNRINAVKWNSHGTLRLTASNDLSLKITDFKSGKIIQKIHTGFETCPSSACFLEGPKAE